jgi:hypothetical protein
MAAVLRYIRTALLAAGAVALIGMIVVSLTLDETKRSGVKRQNEALRFRGDWLEEFDQARTNRRVMKGGNYEKQGRIVRDPSIGF